MKKIFKVIIFLFILIVAFLVYYYFKIQIPSEEEIVSEIKNLDSTITDSDLKKRDYIDITRPLSKEDGLLIERKLKMPEYYLKLYKNVNGLRWVYLYYKKEGLPIFTRTICIENKKEDRSYFRNDIPRDAINSRPNFGHVEARDRGEVVDIYLITATREINEEYEKERLVFSYYK